jgi:hypothetical protein
MSARSHSHAAAMARAKYYMNAWKTCGKGQDGTDEIEMSIWFKIFATVH